MAALVSELRFVSAGASTVNKRLILSEPAQGSG